MEQILARLHYHLSDDDQHVMPSDVLCKLVDAMNMLTYLTASGLSANDGEEFSDYSDFKKSYVLSCAAPAPGSFILPLTIDKVSSLAKIAPRAIILALYTSLVALSSGTVDGTPLANLSPENRVRFSHQLQRMIPEVGSGHRLLFELADDSNQSIEISSDLLMRASLSLNSEDAEQENDISSVIGLVTRVDFDKREVLLHVPYCDRDITCSYGQGTPLGVLFDGRKNRLQVFGQFLFNEDDDPVACRKVSAIAPVDLSPIVIKHEGRLLELTPFLDEETNQLYVVEDARYGIGVFAKNRRELYELAQEQLESNIRHYVQVDDSMLCTEVRAIKNNLVNFLGA